MAGMNVLEVSYRLVTPAFLEGFRTKKEYVRLRETSMKGLIRFWWRALAYAQYHDDISMIRKHEEALFGSTKSASSIVFLPSDQDGLVTDDSDAPFSKYQGIRYLGYGLIGHGVTEAIPYIKAPLQFTIRMLARADFDPLLLDALKILGLIGGVGRRTRRGFGSLNILAIKHNGDVLWESPKNLDGMRHSLHEVLQRRTSSSLFPSFTAFGPQTEIYVLGHGKNLWTLWDEVGSQFQRYRSFGRNGRVGSYPAEKNFKDDHDLMRRVISRQPVSTAPRRSIFGLPHNYRFSTGEQLTVKPGTKSLGRRASPLLFHFHHFEEEGYVAVAVVLPAKFLEGAFSKIAIKGPSQTVTVSGSIEDNYSVITDFITGTIAHNPQQKRFTEVIRLWP